MKAIGKFLLLSSVLSALMFVPKLSASTANTLALAPAVCTSGDGDICDKCKGSCGANATSCWCN